jgi:hypothetical protein
MKIWERYAEYAIIGGLFWAGMLLIVFFSLSSMGSQHFIADALKSFESLKSSLSGAQFEFLTDLSSNSVSAIGVIIIFSTGLLIDAISPSIFSPVEIYIFKQYITQNNYQTVYQFIVQSSSPQTKVHLAALAQGSIFSTRYQRWVTTKYYYTSIMAKITAFCLDRAESGLLEELKDRLNLWRTGRALGGAVGLIGLVMTLSLIEGTLGVPNGGMGLLVVANGVLWLLSFLLVIGQYSRMLHALFSAVEVLHLPAETTPERPASLQREDA